MKGMLLEGSEEEKVPSDSEFSLKGKNWPPNTVLSISEAGH
jgi:hypothetical protein